MRGRLPFRRPRYFGIKLLTRVELRVTIFVDLTVQRGLRFIRRMFSFTCVFYQTAKSWRR